MQRGDVVLCKTILEFMRFVKDADEIPAEGGGFRTGVDIVGIVNMTGRWLYSALRRYQPIWQIPDNFLLTGGATGIHPLLFGGVGLSVPII